RKKDRKKKKKIGRKKKKKIKKKREKKEKKMLNNWKEKKGILFPENLEVCALSHARMDQTAEK
ncbi:hypothetical protein RFI_26698, partial [Reticulomyxa filosa]